jgi:hypothetical protein
MKLEPLLELSDALVAGLVKGQIIRTGGVLHTSANVVSSGARVVAWLRETGSGPCAPNLLAAGMGALASPLGLVGAIPSILSLGATVGFGQSILGKLDHVANSTQVLGEQIKTKLDEIGAKLNRIQWTIELGFANILNGLEQIFAVQELEVVANLKAAAKLAWESQLLEPGSPQRMMRLENALSLATVATEQLLLRAEQEVDWGVNWFKAQRSGRDRLSIPDRMLAVLRRYRQACIACATRTAIIAETASPKAALGGMRPHVNNLQRMLSRIGHAFLRGVEPGESTTSFAYDDLLHSAWASTIPAARIVRWAQRFDPAFSDWSAILEFFRRFNGNLTNIQESIQWSTDAKSNLPLFANLLDGAIEDCDRLSGYLLEYMAADEADLSMNEYRDLLSLSDVITDRSLVFLTRTAS